MLIISACTGLSPQWHGRKNAEDVVRAGNKRLPLLRPAAPNLTVDGFRHGRTFHRSQDQVSYLRR